MPLNSSYSANNSIINHHHFINCFFSRPSNLIFTTYSITKILLLIPVCILIFYLGLQQWRRQRTTSSAVMMSHSDSFTYHLVAMELIDMLGSIFSCCGIYSNHVNIFSVGYCLSVLTWYGESFFHILTCVERYLAVVFPITYLSLKSERGIKIRNISIGCVWLLSSGAACFKALDNITIMLDFCLLIFFLIIVSFCSLSVLCVLTRPGPGEQAGGRERVDQSKHKAFYTIMAILGVLLLRFSWNIIWFAVWKFGNNSCMIMCGVWFNLPCSLVLPLLFLHREGILMCCKTVRMDMD